MSSAAKPIARVRSRELSYGRSYAGVLSLQGASRKSMQRGEVATNLADYDALRRAPPVRAVHQRSARLN
jgi:hypothetical protein